ncbi:hypothetical protein EZV62_027623 [Acer yangbiense]|uniref:Uncharacterized protein n=1 Tax=Acer yangbiense TaxID=1000413 RepID=A0A5C7GV01_9ROSI|nr:hypothetical protein EZV62_027623 [Acer yangbiense]
MAFAHSKLMGPSLRRDLLPTKTPALPLHQVVTREGGRNSQAPKAAVSVSVSRRGAMLYMTAEIFRGATAEPAEARVTKLERKRKIMEKLEKLRERAVVSKPKADTTLRRPQPLAESLLP